MQNVLIEKPYEFVPPIRSTWRLKLIMHSGIFKRWLKTLEGVESSEVRNIERLQSSIDAGHSIMLTPNHSRTADPMVMGFIGLKIKCTFYAMASWHLFNQGWLRKLVLRSMGAFSVNREGLDRQAIDTAIDLLAEGDRMFILFPEGTTSRTNDKLMAMMDGTSFIARAAAKKRAKRDGGKVVVHPISIKYLYGGDIRKACDETLGDIERRISWREQSDVPMLDRIRKLGSALLKLKELQYEVPDPTGDFVDRQQKLVDHLLQPLEKEWLGHESNTNEGVQIRIKNLRMKIFPEISRGEIKDEQEKSRRWKHLEDTYLAQQLDCYPKDYVKEFPSVDRILETIERFEEDLTDKARIHGNLKAVVDVLDPIEVSTKRDRGAVEDPLMAEIREQLQGSLTALQKESALYADT
ncbi:MAG: lysophospholipid acyltransferase family protein [Planctomycetota bacterium]|nr:lysophospholipid acyltransferase family protein [Planctomycetota bacterium]